MFSKHSSTKAILFGGFQEGGDTNDMYVLHLKTLKWEFISSIGQIPSPRHGMAFDNVGNMLYINGGCNYKLKECYTETYFLKVDDYSWYKIENK